MTQAEFELLKNKAENAAAGAKKRIGSAPDETNVSGKRFYFSAGGSDENDGTTPGTAFRTIEKLRSIEPGPGDGVFFRRGDLFRGSFAARPGVTYAAYGEGEKPVICGSPRNFADPDCWENEGGGIWRLRGTIPDCGTLVFNCGEFVSRKLIPSFDGRRFVCRDDPAVPFDFRREMTLDLDLYCEFRGGFTEKPSKGESFPVPDTREGYPTVLYLRCDCGNPGEIFDDIEALPAVHLIKVGSANGVRIDNLRLEYCGRHAVAAGGSSVAGLHVSNCEIGWIGGAVQHYSGTDPNYPAGRRGSVTRYGNGVEIYGGCDGYTVENCHIYQVYDAGATHQITTRGKEYLQKNVIYRNNLIEKCTYGIEYFLDRTDGDCRSLIDGCLIEGNVITGAGFGWGSQRHNKETPALIKSWNYDNTARNFVIRDNILYGSTVRLIHVSAKEKSSLPLMTGNLLIPAGGEPAGIYGKNIL